MDAVAAVHRHRLLLLLLMMIIPVAVDEASGQKSFLEAHNLNEEADNLKLQLDSSVQHP